jgi:hypothetical protein
MPAPALDDDPCLGEGVEDLAVEQLFTELGVEALAVAVIPRASRLDVGAPRADGGDPVRTRLRHELRAIVGSYVVGHSPQDEQG